VFSLESTMMFQTLMTSYVSTCGVSLDEMPMTFGTLLGVSMI